MLSAPHVELVLGAISRVLDAGSYSTVELLWHGGEPLLMGEVFFKRVLAWHRTHKPGQLVHRLQTNMTLLNRAALDWLQPLVAEGSLGTSVEPSDDTRRLANGQSYLSSWHRGYALATGRGLQVGIIYVVAGKSRHRARDVYRFLANLGPGLAGARLSAAVGGGCDVSDREFGEFLEEFWFEWRSDDRPFPVHPFLGWESLRQAEPQGLGCAFRGDCSNIVAIGPDLQVYSCGRMMAFGATPLARLETDLDLVRLLQREPWTSQQDRGRRLLQGPCGQCSWWDQCHGGCPAEAFAATGSPLAPFAHCQSIRRLLGHIRRPREMARAR